MSGSAGCPGASTPYIVSIAAGQDPAPRRMDTLMLHYQMTTETLKLVPGFRRILAFADAFRVSRSAGLPAEYNSRGTRRGVAPYAWRIGGRLPLSERRRQWPGAILGRRNPLRKLPTRRVRRDGRPGPRGPYWTNSVSPPAKSHARDCADMRAQSPLDGLGSPLGLFFDPFGRHRHRLGRIDLRTLHVIGYARHDHIRVGQWFRRIRPLYHSWCTLNLDFNLYHSASG